jgi:hypothetical protein
MMSGFFIMRKVEDFQLIEISGSPTERGIPIWRAGKEIKILFSVDLYSKSLRDLGHK